MGFTTLFGRRSDYSRCVPLVSNLQDQALRTYNIYSVYIAYIYTVYGFLEISNHFKPLWE